jgi:hypothetical protein
MSNVINMSDRRKTEEPEEPGFRCPWCGSGWFLARGIRFEKDGTVGGWCGPVACLDCENRVNPGSSE